MALHSGGDLSKAIPSSTDFSYVVIDGIKLNFKQVSLYNGDTLSGDRIELGGKEVTLGSGVTNVTINELASITQGTYNMFSAELDNGFSIKGFCRTDSHLLYTTSSGIGKLSCDKNAQITDCNGGVLPSDYDFYTYKFGYITAADSADSTTDIINETTYNTATISEGDSIKLLFLIDTDFTVTCFDGDSSLEENSNRIAPFNWQPQNGTVTNY